MSNSLLTPVIAAAAAVVGGLLTAYATRSVERLRLRAALVEKAEQRRLETIEAFLLAVNAWLDWLLFIEEQGWEGQLEELNKRVRQRDDTYRRLLLLGSDELHQWLTTRYAPLEYELKRSYVRQVRYGQVVDDEATNVRRQFSRLLREDLIAVVRPEVRGLRDPLK